MHDVAAGGATYHAVESLQTVRSEMAQPKKEEKITEKRGAEPPRLVQRGCATTDATCTDDTCRGGRMAEGSVGKNVEDLVASCWENK